MRRPEKKRFGHKGLRTQSPMSLTCWGQITALETAQRWLCQERQAALRSERIIASGIFFSGTSNTWRLASDTFPTPLPQHTQQAGLLLSPFYRRGNRLRAGSNATMVTELANDERQFLNLDEVLRVPTLDHAKEDTGSQAVCVIAAVRRHGFQATVR